MFTQTGEGGKKKLPQRSDSRLRRNYRGSEMKKQKTKGVVTNPSLRWCETSGSRKCGDSEDSSRPTGWNLNLLHTHLVTVAFGVRSPLCLSHHSDWQHSASLILHFFFGARACKCALVTLSRCLALGPVTPSTS